LPQIALTERALRRRPGLAQHRHEDADQHGNNADHHQQFD